MGVVIALGFILGFGLSLAVGEPAASVARAARWGRPRGAGSCPCPSREEASGPARAADDPELVAVLRARASADVIVRAGRVEERNLPQVEDRDLGRLVLNRLQRLLESLRRRQVDLAANLDGVDAVVAHDSTSNSGAIERILTYQVADRRRKAAIAGESDIARLGRTGDVEQSVPRGIRRRGTG